MQNSTFTLIARAFFFLASGLFLLACERQTFDSASVRIQMPKTMPASSKIEAAGGTPVDYSLLCFVVNVKGGDLTSRPATSCDIEKGMISGSVAPGGELKLTLNTAPGYNFELFGLLRGSATEACPTVSDTNWSWPLNKIYYLGGTEGIALNPPETKVDIAVSLPDTQKNIVVQRSLATTCIAGNTPTTPTMPTASLGRLSLGTKKLVGTTYSISGSVSVRAQQRVLSGTNYKIKNWKASFQ